MYSDQVIEHFTHPHNVGFLENPTVAVQYGEPSCGDCLLVFLRIEAGLVTDMKYKVLGCAAAIATASMTSVLVIGKTVDEALQLKEEQVAAALGGLPPEKMHCSNLAVGAVRAALRIYLDGSPAAQNSQSGQDEAGDR